MNRFVPLLLCVWGLALCFSTLGYGQTFTFDPANMGCDGQWSTSECWSRSVGSGCTNNPEGVPPVNPPSNSCEVNIVINGAVEYSGNLLLQGNFGSLTFSENGALTVTGNIVVEGKNEVGINVTGGNLQVNGQMVLQNGQNNGAKTTLNVFIAEEGVFEVHDLGGTEKALEIGNDAVLNIGGDETTPLWVKSFDFGQRSEVNITEEAGLIVEGVTNYSGNNSSVNVNGFFHTGSVLITGGAGNQLNTGGNAEVVIDNDLDVRGDSEIYFGGTSEVDIGGNVRVEGGSEVIADEDAQVYVCGNYPPPNDGQGTTEDMSGKFHPSCRILPVDWGNVNAQWDAYTEEVRLNWSTAREWECSHFEIERSINDINGFEVVSTVDAVGWSDQVTDYDFEDKGLPTTQGRVYYRVKQVDIKGTFSYSETVALQLPKVKQAEGVWSAFPNPTTGSDLKVHLSDNSRYHGEKIAVRLINSTNTTERRGVEDEFGLSPVLSDMLLRQPRGLWVVEISWGNKVEYIKVLKK